MAGPAPRPGPGHASRGRVSELLTACVEVGLVDGGGLSLRSGEGPNEPLLGTDAVGETLEHLQFTLGEGPCLDAAASGSPVLVPDLAHADSLTGRWPMFVREASRLDVRAVFAFPLRLGAVGLGAADLYRRAPGPLSREQLAGVLPLMEALTVVLLDPDGARDPDLAAEPLSMSVHRAAGMVMMQLGTSIGEALVRLRGVAFAEGIPIDALADDVVNGRRRFSKEQP